MNHWILLVDFKDLAEGALAPNFVAFHLISQYPRKNVTVDLTKEHRRVENDRNSYIFNSFSISE